MEKSTDTRKTLLICALLAGTTIAAFWNVNYADFVNFDDPIYISENLIVQRGLTPENLKWAFTTFHTGNWHPLTWLSYMTDCELFGLNARASHLVNLGFHVANTLLIFVLLRRLTGALWASAVIAGLFGLHPTHVESVAWVAERKDVLSTFFWLLTAGAYAEYARRRCAGWYGATLVFFVLGLMSKAMLVTLPFVLLLIDLWPLRRLDLNTAGWFIAARRLVFEKLPFFLLAAAASYVTFLAQNEAAALGKDLVFSQRVENALVSYSLYLGKTFWPDDLAVFYPHPGNWPALQVALAVTLIIGISLVAVATLRKRPWFFTGWFWFVGTLVPVIGIVQVGGQSMADRYLYVPSIGLYILAVWTARELIAANRVPRRIVAGVSAAVLIACALVTFRQVGYWKNGLTLFVHAERVTVPSVVVLNNLADALIAKGKFVEARQRFLQALELDPLDHLAWGNLGGMLLREGKLDEASGHFRKALELKPGSAELNFMMGQILTRQNRWKEAVPYYQRAIRGKPAYLDAQINLGNALAVLDDPAAALTNYLGAIRMKPDFAPIHYNVGLIYLETGQVDEALEHLGNAVRLKPDYSEARRQLGIALGRKGEHAKARDAFERAVKHNPNDALARAHLADLLAQASEAERAAAEYQEALRLNPNLVSALNNLAWLRATHSDANLRDGAEAVRLAERACELTQRRQSFALGTLAAALAEAGRFAEAVTTAEKAIELAEAQGQKQIADKNRELLKDYHAGKPWRESAAK